jgi:hypothetical protein
MLGLPHDAALRADEQLWTLRKNARTAVLWQALHPLGLELRLDVAGDTVRTRVEKSVHQARDATVHMRAAMLTKGWV